AVLNASAATANANGNGGQVWLEANAGNNGTGTVILNGGAQINVGAAALASGVSGPVFGGTVTFATTRYAVSSTSTNTIGMASLTSTVQAGLGGVSSGETITLSNRADSGQSVTGTVTSYDPTTGTLVVNVTSTSGSGTYSSWTSNAYAPGPNGSYVNL